jgi:hypothetical protein
VCACRDTRAHGANALTLALTYMPADFKDAGLLVKQIQHANSICTSCQS